MKGPCTDFRARLEQALLGRPSTDEMRALEWHEHLLGCASCRELLEAEQALEELLASLPRPRLSADATRRVLARLRARREADEAALDELLALDDAPAPSDLAPGVLAGLQLARAAEPVPALERLLDRDRVEPPADLAARVLAALEPHRDALDPLLERYAVAVPGGLAGRVRAALAAERAPRPVLRWARATAALAAGLLIALALWLWDPVRNRPWTDGADVDELARVEAALDVPEAELLEELAVLENLDMLEDAGSDLDLLLQMELGPEDEALLAYDDDSTDGLDAR